MRAVVVYESMYGNTHVVADHIALGLGPCTVVVPVGEATPDVLGAADLVVVGGPTHLRGLSWSTSRRMAVSAVAQQHDSANVVDPDAGGPGLRDWLRHLDRAGGAWAAAFDTRVVGSRRLTGRASVGIAERLRHHGYREVASPESFLVDGDSHLLQGEAERAAAWGAQLAEAWAAATAVPVDGSTAG